MTDVQTEDKMANAKEQGQAQFNSIKEMVEALEVARNAEDKDEGQTDLEATALEDAEQAIHEDALSVLVRSDWHEPGREAEDPDEFQILLCTGGPAVRIRGTLNEYSEPEKAWLEVQDWFTPWTEFWPRRDEDLGSKDYTSTEEILLAYARCFYFGN